MSIAQAASSGLPARRMAASLLVAMLAGTCTLSACAQGAAAVQGARKVYFSDCAQGAEPKCVPGNNANAGTDPSSPKRDTRGLDVNALPAGSQLLFAKGGAWSDFSLVLRNLNATPAAPLVLDAYEPAWGGSARPTLATGNGIVLVFGLYNDRVVDGGYTVRNLKLDGRESGQWGVFIVGETRNITLENLEITGFEIAIHFQNMGTTGNTALVIRNNEIHHNRKMGLLGDAHDMVIEGNTIASNNYSGSGFNHGLYLSGSGRNAIVRNNRFLKNSVVNGKCTGGNFTVHGKWDGLLIEGNTIAQDAAEGGCYGLSITPGYTTAEYFRNVVVRGNTIVNVGGCAICFGAAVGPVAENNLLVNLNKSWMSGVVLAANVQSPGIGGDEVDDGAVIRNNTMCFAHPQRDSEQVAQRNAGRVTVSGTVYRTGADARTGPCTLKP
jgi:hypothetical protein